MRRAGLAALVTALVGIGVVYSYAIVTGHAPSWGAAVFAVGNGLAVVATVIIGITGERVRGKISSVLVVALVTTLVLTTGSFLLALTLDGNAEPLVLGLPRRAAIVLYGVGLLPLLVLPVAYALTFDASLDDDDLEQLRALGEDGRRSKQSGGTE